MPTFPAAIRPVLISAKAWIAQPAREISQERNVNKDIVKAIISQSYAEAVKAKDAYRQFYAAVLKVKMEDSASRTPHKVSIPRHMDPQDETDDLVAICVESMEHEKTGILRRNLHNILSDNKHCLHVYFMKAEKVEL